MKNKSIQTITISAIVIAIIALMTFVPNIGYIVIPGTPISICSIHIIVILVAMIFGWKEAAIAGLAFGGLCLLKAVVMPTSPSDSLFINPCVSVLPRILFGFFAGLIFDYFRRIRNVGTRTVMYVIGAVFSTIIHTTLVLGALWLFNRDAFGNPFILIVATVISLNGLIEVVAAGIIAPSLAKAIGAAKKKIDPYSSVPYKEPITIQPFAFALILAIEVFAALFTSNIVAIVPIIVTLLHIIGRISGNYYKKKEITK